MVELCFAAFVSSCDTASHVLVSEAQVVDMVAHVSPTEPFVWFAIVVLGLDSLVIVMVS